MSNLKRMCTCDPMIPIVLVCQKGTSIDIEKLCSESIPNFLYYDEYLDCLDECIRAAKDRKILKDFQSNYDNGNILFEDDEEETVSILPILEVIEKTEEYDLYVNLFQFIAKEYIEELQNGNEKTLFEFELKIEESRLKAEMAYKLKYISKTFALNFEIEETDDGFLITYQIPEI